MPGLSVQATNGKLKIGSVHYRDVLTQESYGVLLRDIFRETVLFTFHSATATICDFP